MKSLKIITATMLAMAFMIVSGNLYTLNVSAGSSDIVVDKASFSEGLDTTKWNAPNDDVVVENGKIIFSKNSTGDTRLITKSAAVKSSQHKELFSADYAFEIKKLPVGEKFIVGFSLENIEAYYEESGNIELVFEDNNGIMVSLLAYDEKGEKLTLVAAQKCGVSSGGTIRVSVDATSEGVLCANVNGKTIYNEKSPVDPAGRMGFLQTGACEVNVTAIEIISHRYDTPENTNIVEDFESGTINVNTLTSKMKNSCNYFPSGIQVEEYDGSSVLMFRNVGMGYFGTTHQYSNFEATFDIPYMLHASILRENGTVLAPNNAGFVFAIADESDEYDSYSYSTAADALVFSSKKVYSMKGDKPSASFGDLKLYDEQSTDGYSVKIKVIDTVLTVSVKSLEGTKYTDVLSYKMGDSTPMGYIHIWSTGQANFAIDNFKITNLDEGAKLLELDYKEGFVTGYEDWQYEPMEVVYLQEAEKAFNWNMIIVYAVAVGVVMVTVTLLVMKIIKTPKKEEDKVNEK